MHLKRQGNTDENKRCITEVFPSAVWINREKMKNRQVSLVKLGSQSVSSMSIVHNEQHSNVLSMGEGLQPC